jgi:hypothetical protein
VTPSAKPRTCTAATGTDRLTRAFSPCAGMPATNAPFSAADQSSKLSSEGICPRRVPTNPVRTAA